METHDLKIHTVDVIAIQHARQTGASLDGVPAVPVVASGGEPVRCCLTNADPGEQLLLFGYRPSLPATSPYAESGAVFIHTDPCDGPPSTTTYPSDWLHRPQVLRAYDERGWIHPATTVHDGTDAPGVLAAVLAQPGVVEVHSRNIAYGCFMFAVTPASVDRAGHRQES